jgi:thermitase
LYLSVFEQPASTVILDILLADPVQRGGPANCAEKPRSFPFMVRYLTMNGKADTCRNSPPFTLRYRRVNEGRPRIVEQLLKCPLSPPGKMIQSQDMRCSPKVKPGVFLILLLIFFLAPVTSSAFVVHVKSDKLTLKAEKVPLQEILLALSDSGIRVQIDPEINPAITASFERRDIQKALESILKGLDHVLIWESGQGPSGLVPKLAEIQVFRPGQKDLMRPLRKASTLSIARNPKDGSFYVRNEILIRLRPGADFSELLKLLQATGGILVGVYPGLGIYRVRLPQGSDVPGLVEEIKKQGEAGTAEPNYAYPVPPAPKELDWTALRMSYADAYLQPKGTPIAVIDSGLKADAGLDKFVIASLDALNPDKPVSDTAGHGTQMALIAAGVVKPVGVPGDSVAQTPIIPIKAFDENGFTSNVLLMESIDFALKNGARVMSLSWGSETKSDFLSETLASASAKGLIIVASAGNEPTGEPEYPAAYAAVIGVGALAPDGKAWEKSNRGDFVALYEPGFASLPVGYKGDPGIYAGTSISAAFAANQIAGVLSKNPKATKQEILEALRKKP